MLIAEYTLGHPILRDTLRRAPECKLTYEESHRPDDGRIRVIVWMERCDVGRFEGAMTEDSSNVDFATLAEVGDRHLYRVDVTGHGVEADIMPVLASVGGVHQHLEATHEGWLNRTRFPNRAAFERVFQFCQEHDVGFAFHRIYETTEGSDDPAPTLTDAQHEILLAAVDSGYLDVPRRCSLAALGESIGVSESAASERFRRGVRNLVVGTLSDSVSDR